MRLIDERDESWKATKDYFLRRLQSITGTPEGSGLLERADPEDVPSYQTEARVLRELLKLPEKLRNDAARKPAK